MVCWSSEFCVWYAELQGFVYYRVSVLRRDRGRQVSFKSKWRWWVIRRRIFIYWRPPPSAHSGLGRLGNAITYYLYLGDVPHHGGPEYAYRLRVSEARPDFDLRVAPSSISVRGAGNVPVTVYALRKDGFTGEIALALKDPPAGLTLSAATVPANQDQAQLMLRVAPMTQEAPVSVSLEGRATIQGREVTHMVVAAENMMQAFEYRHLVPAEELEVAVSGRYSLRATAKLLSESPLKIPAGFSLARPFLGVGPFFQLDDACPGESGAPLPRP